MTTSMQPDPTMRDRVSSVLAVVDAIISGDKSQVAEELTEARARHGDPVLLATALEFLASQMATFAELAGKDPRAHVRTIALIHEQGGLPGTWS